MIKAGEREFFCPCCCCSLCACCWVSCLNQDTFFVAPVFVLPLRLLRPNVQKCWVLTGANEIDRSHWHSAFLGRVGADGICGHGEKDRNCWESAFPLQTICAMVSGMFLCHEDSTSCRKCKLARICEVLLVKNTPNNTVWNHCLHVQSSFGGLLMTRTYTCIKLCHVYTYTFKTSLEDVCVHVWKMHLFKDTLLFVLEQLGIVTMWFAFTTPPKNKAFLIRFTRPLLNQKNWWLPVISWTQCLLVVLSCIHQCILMHISMYFCTWFSARSYLTAVFFPQTGAVLNASVRVGSVCFQTGGLIALCPSLWEANIPTSRATP